MRILIIDDSAPRVALIKEAISSSEHSKYVDITCCETADKGRGELLSFFDILLLDLLIPKKIGSTPQALHSVNLLNDICDPRKKYIRPKLIIGLTADIAELGVYQEQFSRHASVVLDGSMYNQDWLDSLILQIGSLLGAERKITQQSHDKVLVSMHGIRTYGQWQHSLRKEISSHSRSFEPFELKYGFFDLLSFAVPKLRKRKAQQVAARLTKILEEHSGKEIYIVAHSYGTLVVSEALSSHLPANKLKGVFLCGSPLPHNQNIDHIVDSSELTINDCGTHDFILVLARIFILGLGDAGRVGFSRENSRKFINRHFKGGHGLYFEIPAFYERFWTPYIINGESPRVSDERQNYFGEDVVDITIKLLTLAKPLLYTAGALKIIHIASLIYTS